MTTQQTHITDVTLRDAHQCLIATRMRTEDMLPICKKMDSIGFWAMEVWGGATFDSCLRFLNEDPWLRLRALRTALPNTRLSMLLRGQNILGYRHYADDVVHEFVKYAAKGGIDVFRVFDALNDVRNLEASIQAVKDNDCHAQGAICYTTSPVHTLDSFVNTGKTLKGLGCDSIAIKDMAGLLTPVVAVDLYTALSKATGLPVHIHSHSTSGLASICHYEAVMAGCQHIDTAISSLAEGASHPATEALVAALKGTEHDTGLDLNALLEVADYFRDVRRKYTQFESEASAIDPRIQGYQVPGGMISNLYNQLKEQDALDKMQEVHTEISRVRHDLGYPPLVTPTSQLVGAQAVLNVLTGERYKTITNEVKLYCQGKYGKPPGKINPTLRKKAIGRTTVIDSRPADLLSPELTKIRKAIKDLATSEEDVLSYALFPEVARQFFECRSTGEVPFAVSGEVPANTLKQSDLSSFDVSLHGECYHIEVKGSGSLRDGEELYYLWVDGRPEEVVVRAMGQHDNTATESELSEEKIGPGDVVVSMPGTIVKVNVQVGDRVKAGQVLLVVEAMKMETDIQANKAGIVKQILCRQGDKVTPKKVLIHIATE